MQRCRSGRRPDQCGTSCAMVGGHSRLAVYCPSEPPQAVPGGGYSRPALCRAARGCAEHWACFPAGQAPERAQRFASVLPVLSAHACGARAGQLVAVVSASFLPPAMPVPCAPSPTMFGILDGFTTWRSVDAAAYIEISECTAGSLGLSQPRSSSDGDSRDPGAFVAGGPGASHQPGHFRKFADAGRAMLAAKCADFTRFDDSGWPAT
jgi:hypothetical protein